jgi:hypothetical protein
MIASLGFSSFNHRKKLCQKVIKLCQAGHGMHLLWCISSVHQSSFYNSTRVRKFNDCIKCGCVPSSCILWCTLCLCRGIKDVESSKDWHEWRYITLINMHLYSRLSSCFQTSYSHGERDRAYDISTFERQWRITEGSSGPGRRINVQATTAHQC